MKTYIRKSIKGYYVTFPEEIDSNYWAGLIGSTLDEFYTGKWVLLSDEQVAFHVEYPHASISEVWNMKIDEYIEPERTLESAKQEKLTEIDNYDSSSSVNSFNVITNDEVVQSWLTPIERSNYKNSIEAMELLGGENVSFYINEKAVSLPIATAKMMLALILLYADQCFIVTKQHKAAVNALDTIEEVDAFDVTTDYPVRPSFEISQGEPLN